MGYAVINTSTNMVENTVAWDGRSTWHPPEGCIAVEIPSDSMASIGWTYLNGEFSPPTEPAPEEP